MPTPDGTDDGPRAMSQPRADTARTAVERINWRPLCARAAAAAGDVKKKICSRARDREEIDIATVVIGRARGHGTGEGSADAIRLITRNKKYYLYGPDRVYFFFSFFNT